MDDFKQLTEQLLKFYIDTESVDDIGFENFFDDNSSIIGTGKHEFFRNPVSYTHLTLPTILRV